MLRILLSYGAGGHPYGGNTHRASRLEHNELERQPSEPRLTNALLRFSTGVYLQLKKTVKIALEATGFIRHVTHVSGTICHLCARAGPPDCTCDKWRARRNSNPRPSGDAKQLIAMRIAPRLLAQIRRLAARQSKPYQTLIHELLERAAQGKVA